MGVQLMAQGRPLESSGRGTGPWIQALRVYQEQREARQAWEAGRKHEGEAEAGQGQGQGTTTAKPLEAVVLGPSTHSVPSPKPPGCSHRRPPAPLSPLNGNRCYHEAPRLINLPECSDPDVFGHWPSGPWEGQGFLHRPCGPCHSASPTAVGRGTGQRQVAPEPPRPHLGAYLATSYRATGLHKQTRPHTCGLAWRGQPASPPTPGSRQAGGTQPPSAPCPHWTLTHHTLLALVWSTTSRLQCTSSTSSGAIQIGRASCRERV